MVKRIAKFIKDRKDKKEQVKKIKERKIRSRYNVILEKLKKRVLCPPFLVYDL